MRSLALIPSSAFEWIAAPGTAEDEVLLYLHWGGYAGGSTEADGSPSSHGHIHAHKQVVQRLGQGRMGEYAIPDRCVG